VGTPGLSLAADVVVNASGAWADVVASLAGARPVGIRPLRRTLFTSPVRWPEPIHGWPFVADCGERFYFRAEHDQVLVSPADEGPDVPRDATPDELDIARALEAVNQFTTLGLRSVRSAWAGLRCFVADRTPVVGCRDAEAGFFWFAGQGGYGIQMAPALARLGAALLLGEPVPADLEGGVSPTELSPDRIPPG
jgi:D-arginine dehydrogenase